jgi:hypothetical protein
MEGQHGIGRVLSTRDTDPIKGQCAPQHDQLKDCRFDNVSLDHAVSPDRPQRRSPASRICETLAEKNRMEAECVGDRQLPIAWGLHVANAGRICPVNRLDRES